MIASKEQAKFVASVFDYYHMRKDQFFGDLNEFSDEAYENALWVDDRLAHALGMTEEEILAMDKSAAMRWSEKYPFFRYYRNYYFEWNFYKRYADSVSPEDVLLKGIFGNRADVNIKERYDHNDVKQRLITQLKTFDDAVPGTFHKGASITNLQISTEVFISFPEAPKMLKSFIDIYNKVEELFFKALDTDLSGEEIQEYDFLVSWLQMTDIVLPSWKMTYDVVKMYRSAYIEEGYQQLTSYARIRSFIGTSPWRCKEFFDDLDLVQKFARIFPEAKAQMREFAMKIENFECFFTWSDAKPIVFSPEEEREQRDFCETVGEQYLDPAQRAKEPTIIYVPKTQEEMADWMFYAHQLKMLVQPSSKGGLLLPEPEADLKTLRDLRRITKRVECRCRGNRNG